MGGGGDGGGGGGGGGNGRTDERCRRILDSTQAVPPRATSVTPLRRQSQALPRLQLSSGTGGSAGGSNSGLSSGVSRGIVIKLPQPTLRQQHNAPSRINFQRETTVLRRPPTFNQQTAV